MALSVLEIAAGVMVGLFSALFGVGGGILMVPFMVLALGFGQHIAEGTSLVVIVPTAVAGVVAHRRRGYVSLPHGAILGAGGIAGALLGAEIALGLAGTSLQSLFGALVIVFGVRLTLEGIRGRR